MDTLYNSGSDVGRSGCGLVDEELIELEQKGEKENEGEEEYELAKQKAKQKGNDENELVKQNTKQKGEEESLREPKAVPRGDGDAAALNQFEAPSGNLESGSANGPDDDDYDGLGMSDQKAEWRRMWRGQVPKRPSQPRRPSWTNILSRLRE